MCISRVQRRVEDGALTVVADSPKQANAALAALIDGGVELADFSMSSPSLDEVFFALTGGETRTDGRGPA